MKTTLSVYECGEFHNLGKSFIGIESAEEAVRLWESIPACNMHGIKAINIYTEDDNGEEIEDFEVIYGGVMHLEMLKYYPETRKNVEAVRYMKELQNLISNLRVEGHMPCISDGMEKVPARHRQHR